MNEPALVVPQRAIQRPLVREHSADRRGPVRHAPEERERGGSPPKLLPADSFSRGVRPRREGAGMLLVGTTDNRATRVRDGLLWKQSDTNPAAPSSHRRSLLLFAENRFTANDVESADAGEQPRRGDSANEYRTSWQTWHCLPTNTVADEIRTVRRSEAADDFPSLLVEY